jgi:hypothetical protein
MSAPSFNREKWRQELVSVIRSDELARERRIDTEPLEHVGSSVNFSKEF